MALATTLPFSAFIALLESTTTPNTFLAPCGLKERSLALTKDLGETVVPDCTDEDFAPYVERDPISKSAKISGNGVMARESIARWQAAFDSDAPTKVKVTRVGTGTQGGGSYTFLVHISSFEQGATKGERCTVSIEAESTGPVVWAPAA